jgi:radical SAM family uncharacterized protein
MSHLDEILYRVTRPARYTGGEWNAQVKDWEAARVRVALAYPDLYEIGMSNLAIPILYDILNSQPDVLCERVYAPWGDMAQALRDTATPLYSLESKHLLKDFDVLGFSLGYELTYTNVLNMLDLAGIPVLASERDESCPLIIAGGGSALNPEPLADFIDLFVIGDGEEVALELLDAFRSLQGRSRPPREELLRGLARVPGIYVPSLYQVEYRPDGTLASFIPTAPEAPPSIERRLVAKLPPPVTRPVMPYIEAVHDRGMVEIQRGCTRGCRFCQAGMIYRPVRERPPEEVTAAVGDILKHCGYSTISLVSLSTSDYPHIEGLVTAIAQRYREQNLTISLPSLRIDGSSVRLMATLPTQKKMGLTFAPEAGSERLRQAINKGVDEEEILATASAAFERGWNSIKLYFMVGLPTETPEDIESIAGLARRLMELGRSKGKQPRIKVSVSPFIPKPHTPFQWVAQDSQEALGSKYEALRTGLKRARAQPSWQNPQMSLLEAVFSRGDRRLGKVLHRAWTLGCSFDAWSECFDFPRWLQSFEESGLDPHFYAHRERGRDELLPWAHIDAGVRPAFLWREYQRTFKGQQTPDCRHAPCSTCGLEGRYEGCHRKYAALTGATREAED